MSCEFRHGLLGGLALAFLATVPRAQDPAVETLRDQYRSIEAQLRAPATFEQGRLELHAFYERIKTYESLPVAAVFLRARQLAIDPALTPEPEERLRLFREAADVIAAEDPDQAADMQHYRASLLHDLGRPREARTVLEETLRRYPQAKKKRFPLLVDLADIARRLGDLGAARAHVETIEREARAAEEHRSSLEKAGLIRALVSVDLGLPEIGAVWLRDWAARVQARWERGAAEDSELFEARLELLRVARGLDDHGASIREAEILLAEDFVAASRVRTALVELHLGIAELEEERDERLAGGERLRSEPVGADRVRRALELDLPRADLVLGRTWLVEQALDLGRDEMAREELLRLAEVSDETVPLALRVQALQLEARLLLSQALDASGSRRLAALKEELVVAWATMVATWRSAPRTQEGVPFLKYSHRRGVLSLLIQLELAATAGEEGVRRALEHVVAAQTLASLSRWEPGEPPPSLERITEAVFGADTAHGILVYLAARDRSHVFALDRERVTHHPLAPSAALEVPRRAYVSWLLTRGVASMQDAAQRELAQVERRRARSLAEALLPPELVQRIESWERLTITGTDTLGPVPFAWLPIDGERLGARAALALVPTLPFSVVVARRRDARRSRNLVLVTDAVPSEAVRRHWSSLERIGLGVDERERVRGLYEAGVLVLADGEATEQRLRSLDLGDVAILQLLVHAVQESERTIPVSLVLGSAAGDQDEGLFRADRIASLRGAPRVVLLTACGSGQGPTRRGDPLVASPIGAWLAQGTEVVIAARNELTLGEANRVTDRFHARVRGHGDSPAEAMRVAREELVQAEPDLAPFLHAMLHVVGAGHEPLFEPLGLAGETANEEGGPWKTIALVAAIAALLGFGGAALRRRAG